jgi:cation:H+ antiporter
MLVTVGLLAGILLLLAGGTALVRGGSGIAASHGVSPMVVGLTVVAFGTSAPELVVNLIGAIENETAIAFGNVVGSNIANLGLVLGLAGLVAPIDMHSQLIRRELPLFLLATTILVIMAADGTLRGEPDVLDRSDALILMLLFLLFLYITLIDVMRQRLDPLLTTVEHLSEPVQRLDDGARSWWFAGIGLTGLLIGGQLTISCGVALAEALGVSKTLIGMFVIAVGTSLPELVTSVIAAYRREPDLCIGNVIGSNLFNGLMVLPASALITPVVIPAGGVGDLVMSFLLAAVLIPIFIFGNRKLTRAGAALLLFAYIAFVALRIAENGN